MPILPAHSSTLPNAAAASQGAYYLATGPKTDLWLVRTVGGLVGIVGSALLAAGLQRRVTPEIELLGAGSAAALAAVEGYYVVRDRISPIYLADAAAEVLLLATWVATKPTG